MLTPIDPVTAAHRASTLGHPAVDATWLTERELSAFTADAGMLVLATVREDPILEREEAYLPAVLPGPAGDAPAGLEPVVAAVCRRFEVGRAVVTLPFRHPSTPRLERIADYLDLPVDSPRPAAKPAGDPTSGTGVDTREATSPSDWRSVRELLEMALMEGYGAGEPDWPVDDLRHRVAVYVRESFDPPDPSLVGAFVAVEHDDVVAHATWMAPEPDLLRGRSTAALLDLTTRPGHKGRGLRERLVRDVATRLRGEAEVLRGQVVIEPGRPERPLIEKLLADGWMPAHSEAIYRERDL